MITLLLFNICNATSQTDVSKVGVTDVLGHRISSFGQSIKLGTARFRTSNYYRAAKDMLEKNTPKYLKELGDLIYRIGEVLSSTKQKTPLITLENLKRIETQLSSLKTAVEETSNHIRGDIKHMKEGNHVNNAKEIEEKLNDFNNKFKKIDTSLKNLKEKITSFEEKNKDEIARSRKNLEAPAASRIQRVFKSHLAKKTPSTSANASFTSTDDSAGTAIPVVPTATTSSLSPAEKIETKSTAITSDQKDQLSRAIETFKGKKNAKWRTNLEKKLTSLFDEKKTYKEVITELNTLLKSKFPDERPFR